MAVGMWQIKSISAIQNKVRITIASRSHYNHITIEFSDFVYVTDATLSLIQSRCPPPIHSNHELKEILSNEISVDQSDPQAIADICNEFIKFGIEVPRGYGQIIPITRSTGSNVVLNHLQDKFTALKLEYKRSKWI